MRKWRTATLVAVLSVLTVLTLARGSEPAIQPASAPSASHQIEEDDPRWDCRTMGNHQCSATGYAGENVVIEFDAYGMPVRVIAAILSNP
ncbi:hypothetical protein RHODO2019_10775 [Rhodococcus antarcticus]|uniref:DUF4333 domain-containing protein n=1 Tax=Rhodococcus antarcticus TaxID=2987751 RepID=A0ABY6NX50_9NOCA|nr:hypothetical protein [Rhodococcus antarcticus]UZJ23691.1 hypothetical protein RHODO2019_10775 [Rhodococcus antarcticus]